MSRSSTGAPVVVTVAFSNSRSAVASSTTCAAAPSSSIDWLPGSRLTIWAWVPTSPSLSGKNGRSALRMLPSLSWRRKSTYSGLSSWRSSSGMAEMRSRVASDEAVRISALSVSPAASARAVALRSSWPATRSVGLPDSDLDEVVGELERGQRAVTTAST